MATTMLTTRDIIALHARYSAKDAADDLVDCLVAADEGRLYEVDTQGSGDDCLLVADSDEDAVGQVAAETGREPGTEGAAATARWTARAVRWAVWERNPLHGSELTEMIFRGEAAAAAVIAARREIDAARDLLRHGDVTAEALAGSDWRDSAWEWARDARAADYEREHEWNIREFVRAFCARCAAAFRSQARTE